MSCRDLLDISPAGYGEAAGRWQRMAARLRARADELNTGLARLDGWSGAAAETAKAALAGYREQLTDTAEVFDRITAVFHTAGPRVGDARRRLLHAFDEARGAGLDVDLETGRVLISPEPATPRGVDLGRRAEIEEWISKALADATQADNDAADALRRLTAQAAGLAPAADDPAVIASSTAIPPRDAAPADVRGWWDSLSPMQQESLLFTHTDQLGRLDGLPATVRDRANRARLAEQKAHLEADRAGLTAMDGRLTEAQRAQLDDINRKLDGIAAIENRLHTTDPGKQPAFLLAVDTRGNGRAIVAAGNPDTAVNVATFVPGTGANLAGVGGLMDRSDLMLGSAVAAGSPSTSVITWVGYDAPQDIVDAAQTKFAEGATTDLDRFQDGLRASHQGAPSHNTVVGHSYGSTVIGHTAHREQINADDVVFAGSPGVGVSHVSELGIPPEHVHATVAEHDIIQLTNLPGGLPDPHGISPADPAFGGSTFTSSPGEEGSMWTFGLSEKAHSQYWDVNSDSLRNFGRIIAGEPTY